MAKILSIEIDNKNIRILEGSRFFNSAKINKAIIFDSRENSIDDGKITDLDACVFAIKQALQKNKIKTRKATIIINNKNIIIRTLKLPYLKNKTEANMLINNELEHLMTIDIDLYKIVYIQKQNSNTEKGKVSNYIVYGISHDLLNQYMELSKKLNLELIHFDLSFRALEKLYTRKLKLNKNETIDITSSTAFVDINYDTITFSIIGSGVVEFSRTYESGVKDVINNYSTIMSTDEKTALEDIFNLSLDTDIKANVLKQNIIQESITEWIDDFNRYIRYFDSNNKENPIKKYMFMAPIQI